MSIEVLSVSDSSCGSHGLRKYRSYGSLYNEDVLLAVETCASRGATQPSRLCRGAGCADAVGDLLNFAVARTHLLKMITPELQAIQTLCRVE
jgi:hypothetical protein